MTGSWLSVAAAFGLVALNGFFVATEFALVKVRPTRLDELALGSIQLTVEEMDGPRIASLLAARSGGG